MALSNKHLDGTGLAQVWANVKKYFVAKEAGKGLSTNDYTAAEKKKLGGIEEGAQKNVQADWDAAEGASSIKNKPGSLPANGGNAETVNGHTVKSDVPENAVFTDTKPTGMKGATADAAGTAGYVPAPEAGAQDKFLKADGTWETPAKTVYKEATTTEAGLMSAADKVKVDGLENTYAKKATNLSGYGITDAYTKTEADAAVKKAVDAAVTGVYKVKGSIAFASLPTKGMVAGDVYNITDDFTTTDAFVEGAGKKCKAGSNVVYTDKGWDVMAGTYDFSDFVMKADIQFLTNDEIDAICTMPA